MAWVSTRVDEIVDVDAAHAGHAAVATTAREVLSPWTG